MLGGEVIRGLNLTGVKGVRDVELAGTDVWTPYYPYLATKATFEKRSEKPVGPTPCE